MTRMICDMSVSLDGYVTGPNDSREHPFGDGAEGLHSWIFDNPTEADLAIIERGAGAGAIIMGRKSFEKNEGDGGWGDGGPDGDLPCFVVSHREPPATFAPVFTFVDDVPRAIDLAKQAAAGKDVYFFGATIMQQALPLGLVDELRLHVVPVLIGGGTPLFASLEDAVALERTDVTVTPAATHLTFRVVR